MTRLDFQAEVVSGCSVRTFGSGAPLVMLHGWYADSATNWGGALDALAKWRVIAVDLPGHGDSPAPEHFSFAGCAEAVAAVCDELHVRDATVVGYSMGGPVAQQLARDRPDLVGGLVMVATAARLLPSAWHHRALAMARQSTRLLHEASSTVAMIMHRPTKLRHDVAHVLRASHKRSILRAGWELARWDSRSWVGELRVLAASVVTTRDHAVPPEAQRELADLLKVPAARRFEVDDGHFLCLEPEFGTVLATAARSLRRRRRHRAGLGRANVAAAAAR